MLKLIAAVALLVVSALANSAQAREIVIVGDSLSCGAFGPHLVQRLSTADTKVTLYCTPSSAPIHWINARNPRWGGRNPGRFECKTLTSPATTLSSCGGNGDVIAFSRIIADHPRAQYIVALGTNSLGNVRADSNYTAMVNAIGTADRTCLWIGPPHLRPEQARAGFSPTDLAAKEASLNSFYTSLSQTVAPTCRLIDSRPSTISTLPGGETRDGVHRADAPAIAWANAIIPSILRNPNQH